MTTFTATASATWRVGVRAVARRRLTWWTAVLAALFWWSADEVRRDPLRGWSSFAAIGTMLVTFTGAGRPGDDLQSGALAADLLAGASPVGLVVGSAAATLTAALPGLLVGLSALGPATLDGGRPALLVAGAALLAVIAWAALATLGGVLLAGMGSVVILFPLGIVSGFPPDALPVDQWPMPIADLARAAWGALPLPHHVATTAANARLAAGVATSGVGANGHLLALAFGAAACAAGAVGVLRLRILRGRWT